MRIICISDIIIFSSIMCNVAGFRSSYWKMNRKSNKDILFEKRFGHMSTHKLISYHLSVCMMFRVLCS